MHLENISNFISGSIDTVTSAASRFFNALTEKINNIANAIFCCSSSTNQDNLDAHEISIENTEEDNTGNVDDVDDVDVDNAENSNKTSSIKPKLISQKTAELTKRSLNKDDSFNPEELLQALHEDGIKPKTKEETKHTQEAPASFHFFLKSDESTENSDAVNSKTISKRKADLTKEYFRIKNPNISLDDFIKENNNSKRSNIFIRCLHALYTTLKQK